ncbi:hypothetical protein WwAna0610 [Wolbachia endosymbiont of Drosophila ananassae]|nr:hypothetical protein WwAna0610 [Wolbachia endosymbiont of Drosophila ananassae]
MAFIENSIKAKTKTAVTVFFSLFCATDIKLSPFGAPLPATKLSNDSLMHCTIIEVTGIGANDLLPAWL